MKINVQESLLAARAACKGLDDKLAQDVTLLALYELTPMADYFVIATAGNPNQMRAMGEACEAEVYKTGMKLINAEGHGSGWYLMDFGGVIVHIFLKDQRQFYNLERIWADAQRIACNE